MSVRRLDPHQPKDFAFTPENLAWARKQIQKYPEGRQQAAILPLLWRAQEQHDEWLPEPAIRYVADLLGMAYIRAYEIATFYTMFNLSPVGRYHVQVCGTTPCMLRGANDIKAACQRLIGPQGRVTPEGVFSWVEVECLGACVNAPMVQIGKDYYEDLTAENFEALLEGLRRGRTMKTGPQNGRQFSAPVSGAKTLTDAEALKAPLNERAPERADEERKTQDTTQAKVEAASPIAAPTAKSGNLASIQAERSRFQREEGPADDFSKIAGLDPDAITQLNEIGLTRYGQVGRLSEEDQSWLETRYPRLKGKTAQWSEAAKTLAATATPGGLAPDAAGHRSGKDGSKR